jgi:hypothetical protein
MLTGNNNPDFWDKLLAPVGSTGQDHVNDETLPTNTGDDNVLPTPTPESIVSRGVVLATSGGEESQLGSGSDDAGGQTSYTGSDTESENGNDGLLPTPTPTPDLLPATEPVTTPKLSDLPAAKPTMLPSSPGQIACTTPGRRGVAWDGQLPPDALQLLDNRISWYYNWATSSNLKSTAAYYPMIPSINEYSDKSLPTGPILNLLGPNEPDMKNDRPEDVADFYANKLLPLVKNGRVKLLTTPAVTNSPTGLQWLETFLEKCPGCRNLQIAAHFYGSDLESLQKQIAAMCTTTGKSIWITELGFTTWQDDKPLAADVVADLQKKMIAWLDESAQQRCVTKYAFLASEASKALGRANTLVTKDGQLTPFGKSLPQCA